MFNPISFSQSEQHIGVNTPRKEQKIGVGSFFLPIFHVFESLIIREKNIKNQTFNNQQSTKLLIKRKEKIMNNNFSKISGSVCIITNLVILALAALELKDKIVARRMKREHVASQSNQNGQ